MPFLNFIRRFIQNQKSSYRYSYDFNAGVSFVEIMVTIGILFILITISVPIFLFFQKESELDNNVEEIINTLKIAQNMTVASEGASQYGVYFDTAVSPNQYVLFKGANFVSRYLPFDKISELPVTIEIYGINLGGGNEVVFDRLIGTTNQAGNFSLRLKTDPTKTKTIYIEGSGQVGLSIPSAPVNGRTKDSRHIHFDLGWSIQDANSLKFNFVDAGQIETIDMANYFNFDKTEFDWHGTFLIGGVDQVFRIHSHSLNAFNTLLCIHRDRNDNKNTEEVIIYIIDGAVDKDIAHYLADVDDTVNEGLYGGTKEIQ